MTDRGEKGDNMIYRVAVRRDFSARHFLIGGDWGSENALHAHPYAVEVCLEGTQLNEHGYLVDITAIEAALDGILARISGGTLNDLPEFAGLNPSVERLAELFCRSIIARIAETSLSAVSVRVFENMNAWADCRRELP